ncbi:MAG: DUF5317 domain-containing protein [Acidimicrobiia bacterium]|nr:DUF5317 domain-containing protein [Acidimicrobiia bacterium]
MGRSTQIFGRTAHGSSGPADMANVLMLAVILVGLLLVPLLGGSVSRLGELRLVQPWLVFVGLGLQLLITTVLPDLPVGPARVIHCLSYGFIGAFLVCNRRLPGVPCFALGTLLNVVAILANGGTMPARRGALQTAGLAQDHAFENSAVVAHPKLAVLGDVFGIPSWVPLANVFSVGDVLIDAGALILILTTCLAPPAPSEEPEPEPSEVA